MSCFTSQSNPITPTHFSKRSRPDHNISRYIPNGLIFSQIGPFWDPNSGTVWFFNMQFSPKCSSYAKWEKSDLTIWPSYFEIHRKVWFWTILTPFLTRSSETEIFQDMPLVPKWAHYWHLFTCKISGKSLVNFKKNRKDSPFWPVIP